MSDELFDRLRRLQSEVERTPMRDAAAIRRRGNQRTARQAVAVTAVTAVLLSGAGAALAGPLVGGGQDAIAPAPQPSVSTSPEPTPTPPTQSPSEDGTEGPTEPAPTDDAEPTDPPTQAEAEMPAPETEVPADGGEASDPADAPDDDSGGPVTQSPEEPPADEPPVVTDAALLEADELPGGDRYGSWFVTSGSLADAFDCGSFGALQPGSSASVSVTFGSDLDATGEQVAASFADEAAAERAAAAATESVRGCAAEFEASGAEITEDRTLAVGDETVVLRYESGSGPAVNDDGPVGDSEPAGHVYVVSRVGTLVSVVHLGEMGSGLAPALVDEVAGAAAARLAAVAG